MMRPSDGLPCVYLCRDVVDVLKALVIQQAQKLNHFEVKVSLLQEQLNLALARRYAASSEKRSPDQIRLFDEAEVEQAAEIDEVEASTIPEHTRQKRGRRPLPDSFPRTEQVYTLADDERLCPHDGNVLTEISEVISEQLDIIPANACFTGCHEWRGFCGFLQKT